MIEDTIYKILHHYDKDMDGAVDSIKGLITRQRAQEKVAVYDYLIEECKDDYMQVRTNTETYRTRVDWLKQKRDEL